MELKYEETAYKLCRLFSLCVWDSVLDVFICKRGTNLLRELAQLLKADK